MQGGQQPGPGRLVNVGLDLTRTGRHVGDQMVGQADQGQYDERRDALGVSSAGLLIRRDVYLQLGGFDPAFDGDGDGLDLSWRTHLIGRQVIVVPAARVHQDATTGDDPDTPAPRSAGTLRRHRQVALARCSLPVLPLMALWLLLSGLLLALTLLLLKRPRRAWREFAQATAPFGVARIIGARWRFLGRASVRRRNLRTMFVPWTGAIAHAMDAIGDAAGPERGRARLLRNPGLWSTLALVVAAGFWWRDLWGSGALRGTGTGLRGGALQPFATDADGIWRLWRDAWSGPGLGTAGADAPYLVLLAGPAWLAQHVPGVADAASGAAVVAWLLLLAMPLSGLVAYRAGRVATRAQLPRAVAALAWGTLPTLTTAVSEGRIGPVVAHVVLPFAFAGVFATGRRTAGVALTCGTVLAAALTGAFSPPVLIALSVLALGAAIVGRGWARLRALVVAVLPWALLGGWTWDLRQDWRAALTGPGGTTGTAHAEPWQVVLLHPGGAGSYLVWLSVPVVLLGVLGLVRSRGVASVGLVAAGLLGLAAALAAPHLHLVRWSGGPRTPWAGSGVDLLAAALIGSALLGVRGQPDRRPGWVARRLLQPLTATAGAFLAVLAGLIAWGGAPGEHLRAAPAPQAPAVQRQVTGPPAARLLRLTVARSGVVTYALQGRETGPPAASLRQTRPSGGAATAGVVSRLLAGSAASDTSSDAVTGLRDLAVAFVVVDGPGRTTRITQALRRTAGLTDIPDAPADTASVWRVERPGAAAISRVWVTTGGRATRAVDSVAAHARTGARLPAGAEDRQVVLSEAAGWSRRGTVGFNGRVLPVASRRGSTISYAVPGSPGTVRIDPGLARPRWQLAQGALAVVVLYLAVPFGNRRSRRSA